MQANLKIQYHNSLIKNRELIKYCKTGNLKAIKLLLNTVDNNININYDDYEAIKTCFIFGRIKIAKFLFSLSNNSINIEKYINHFFRICYNYGHLKMIKFLISGKILPKNKNLKNLEDICDFSSYISEIFIFVCFYGYFKFANINNCK